MSNYVSLINIFFLCKMYVQDNMFCNMSVVCICIIFVVCTFDKNMRYLPHIYQTYVKQALICIMFCLHLHLSCNLDMYIY